MAKIRVLLIIGFAFLATALQAQPDLKVQGTSPDLYVVHTVAAKETWFKIGQLYNLPAASITAYNGTTVQSKLAVGQSLKIPLKPANFSQDGKRNADEVFVPLHYIVQEKEWMYRISQNHNKVPIATLEKWNGVTNDQVKPGMRLVIGYLKVKQNQSALAAMGSKKLVTAPPVVKEEAPAVITKPEETVVKTEPKKEEPKKEAATVAAVTKEEPKTPAPAPATPAVTNTSNTESYNGFRGGYFKSSYSEVGKGATGNAGIFRSTSGWKDGKYYALMNNVPAGTIVKITFPSTNKSVYAKVLGQLPDMRESMGLTMRLSDAAAAELGAEIGKFYVDVKY